MDSRTTYLQELMISADFLQIQRNMKRGLHALAQSIFGDLPIFTPFGSITAGSGLSVNVPPLAAYAVLENDPVDWPATPNIILPADNYQTLVQAINYSTTNIIFTMTTSAGQKQFFLVQGQIINANDTNNAVLPFFPLIQTITIAGSTTTKLYLAGTTGMTVGDIIVVQGIATGNGNPTFIATKGSDGGGLFITLTNALASAPGTNKVVRDVNPNSGNPLAGINNDGAALPTDRVVNVALTIKRGPADTNPSTVIAPDAGKFAMFLIGPVNHGASNLSGVLLRIASNAPYWPGLAQHGHHTGQTAMSSKIDLINETNYIPINKDGDAMQGQLGVVLVPTAKEHATSKDYVDGKIAGIGGLPTAGNAGWVLTKKNAGSADAEWKASGSGIPVGGSTGFALRKTSGVDFAAGWAAVREVPAFGNQNQVLTKGSGDNYDWQNPVAGGGTSDHGALTGLADDDHMQYLRPVDVVAGTNITLSPDPDTRKVKINASGGAAGKPGVVGTPASTIISSGTSISLGQTGVQIAQVNVILQSPIILVNFSPGAFAMLHMPNLGGTNGPNTLVAWHLYVDGNLEGDWAFNAGSVPPVTANYFAFYPIPGFVKIKSNAVVTGAAISIVVKADFQLLSGIAGGSSRLKFEGLGSGVLQVLNFSN